MQHLTTPLIADAALRRNAFMHIAAPGCRGLSAGMKAFGRVRPARHVGSVDVFLEAIVAADPGDVLVVDNGGRVEEGCVGDLVTLEAKAHDLGGIVIWGVNRDTTELREIALPVFSYGTWPCGPTRLDARPPDALTVAHFGDFTATREHVVFADDDGVVFIRVDQANDVFAAAEEIFTRERAQADRVREGVTLVEQFRFHDFLAARERDPRVTFRSHLRSLAGEIEQ